MSTEIQDKSYRLDPLKWVVVAALVAAGVVGNTYFAEYALGYRVAALVGVALVAIFVALQTEKGAQLWDLLAEARKELRKVVWPTAQERTQTTVIVLIAVAVMSLILWALDSILGWLASMIIG